MFPVYIFVIMVLAFVLAFLCLVYCFIYKRHINRALVNAQTCRYMPAPFHVALAAAIMFLLLTVGAGLAIIFRMDYAVLDSQDDNPTDINTICAEISEIEIGATAAENSMTVEALEYNYESYHAELTFHLYEGLEIVKNGRKISATELKAGDVVAITLLTDLSGVEDIIKVEVLDKHV